MPLIFQRHRPPELDQEIRALWARVDRLDRNAIAAGGVGTQGPPGPPGETVLGTVHSWLQRIEFGAEYGPGSELQNHELVPSITRGYTVLDFRIALLRTTHPLSTTKITIRGNQPFKAFFPNDDIPPGRPPVSPHAIFYDQITIPSRAFPELPLVEVWKATFDPSPYGGPSGTDLTTGLAYIPIVPLAVDSLRLIFEFAWTSSTACFAAFFMGRYVLHASEVFSEDPCSFG